MGGQNAAVPVWCVCHKKPIDVDSQKKTLSFFFLCAARCGGLNQHRLVLAALGFDLGWFGLLWVGLCFWLNWLLAWFWFWFGLVLFGLDLSGPIWLCWLCWLCWLGWLGWFGWLGWLVGLPFFTVFDVRWFVGCGGGLILKGD